MKVPFVDLHAQYEHLKGELLPALQKIMERGDFILGEAVERFEEEFAAYVGTKHAVGVGSGTAALEFALKACGVGAGDEVILPANTFIATAIAVSAIGARPVLVDIEREFYAIDPAAMGSAITERTRAIMPVHLYGHPANMAEIMRIAEAHAIPVVEDACQAHGALFDGRRAGSIGNAGCFSFYPAKNLGAYGDAGLVATNDDRIAEEVRMYRNYGQSEKYHHDVKGNNSRLDSLQAAVLSTKLKHLDAWNSARRELASAYNGLLADSGVALPTEASKATHVYHLYVIRFARRDELREFLSDAGISTGIHYPIPIHRQKCYAELGSGRGSFPVTEEYAEEILSLPMYPELPMEYVSYVAGKMKEFCAG